MSQRLSSKFKVFIIGFSLIIGGLLWGRYGNMPDLQAEGQQTTTSQHVMFSKVRDNTITVSWVTPGATTGRIECGDTPTNLSFMAEDVRGPGTVDQIHLVTLSGLFPNTTYYCDLFVDEVRDDNGGMHYQVQTGPTLLLPTFDNIYGQIFAEDGVTPLSDCLVHLTLSDNDGLGDSGSSAMETTISDSNGGWSLNRGDMRVSDLSRYFAYSPTGDWMTVTADCGSEGQITLTVDTGTDLVNNPISVYKVALGAITITGPAVITFNQVLTLNSQFSPLTATQPITYTWLPPSHDKTENGSAVYYNLSQGLHNFTLIANNGVNSVTNTHQVMVGTIPPTTTLTGGIALTHTGFVARQVSIPVMVDQDVTGRNILAVDFTLAFSPTVLQPTGYSQNGTLSEDCNLTYNKKVAGQVRVGAICIQPLSGAGSLLNLTFMVTETVGAETDLIFTAFQFNEGEPTAQMQNGHFTAQQPLISILGAVYYALQQGLEMMPVSEVDLTLQQGLLASNSQTTTTNLVGEYIFTTTEIANYTVSLDKIEDERGAISAYDAALIQRYAAGLQPLSDLQQRACDVSGDGSCSSYDAALIARYLVGSAEPGESETGEWYFNPSGNLYPMLETSLTDEDYQAGLMGDVTGNWGTTQGRLISLNGIEMPTTSQKMAQATLLIPDQLVLPQGARLIPVLVEDVIPNTIIALDFVVGQTGDWLTILGVETAGTLSADWEVLYHQGRIISYNTTPLTEDGVLLYLKVHTDGNPTETTSLTIEEALLNEGLPPVSGVGGELTLGYPVYLPLVQK